jgi:hypothetical protein
MVAALFPSGPPAAEPAAVPPPAAPAKPSLSRAVTTGRTAVGGEFGTAPGPDGRIWKAIGGPGYIDVAAKGTRWLAFRAGSFAVPRKLVLSTPAGSSQAVRLTTSEKPVIFGPFRLKKQVRFAIKGTPPPRSPAPGAPAGSFFVSEPVLSAVPVAVLPGQGFWQIEYSAGRRSVWLRDYGVATLFARPTEARRAWIRFRASVLAPQTLVIRLADSPRTRLARFKLLPGADKPIVVGPIPLVGGSRDVRFDALPGASQASEADTRAVSVEFKDLDAAVLNRP